MDESSRHNEATIAVFTTGFRRSGRCLSAFPRAIIPARVHAPTNAYSDGSEKLNGPAIRHYHLAHLVLR